MICRKCGEATERLFPLPHVGPDGIYSYAHNVGDMNTFDRKMAKIEENKQAKSEGRKPNYVDIDGT